MWVLLVCVCVCFCGGLCLCVVNEFSVSASVKRDVLLLLILTRWSANVTYGHVIAQLDPDINHSLKNLFCMSKMQD